MLTSMEERALHFPKEHPLIGWRLFRVRRSQSGFVLSAPLIRNPDFERFPSRTIEAICYQAEHRAPAPGCRCGLYAAIEGTLDSLPGYLSDSAHDRDPPIYADVACTGRAFVDLREVRAQRIEILPLATPTAGGRIPACRRKLPRNSASDIGRGLWSWRPGARPACSGRPGRRPWSAIRRDSRWCRVRCDSAVAGLPGQRRRPRWP